MGILGPVKQVNVRSPRWIAQLREVLSNYQSGLSWMKPFPPMQLSGRWSDCLVTNTKQTSQSAFRPVYPVIQVNFLLRYCPLERVGLPASPRAWQKIWGTLKEDSPNRFGLQIPIFQKLEDEFDGQLHVPVSKPFGGHKVL